MLVFISITALSPWKEALADDLQVSRHEICQVPGFFFTERWHLVPLGEPLGVVSTRAGR